MKRSAAVAVGLVLAAPALAQDRQRRADLPQSQGHAASGGRGPGIHQLLGRRPPRHSLAAD